MKLPEYARPMPSFLNRIYPKAFTTFLTGEIYLNRGIFEDLQKESPNPFSVSYLIHEEEHRKNSGIISSFRYQLFPKVRLAEELNAYRVQFKYLRSRGLKYDIENVARKLSGPMYFYSISYSKAKELLEKAWQEA